MKIQNKPLIEYILEKMNSLPNLEEIFIITNNKYYGQFKKWKTSYLSSKPLEIINDGTTCNEGRLGAVGDINFVLQQKKINDDLLIIAGDNLFGFSLSDFHSFFQQKGKSIVAFRDLQDLEKVRGRFGVGVLEQERLIHFAEKPAEPKSSIAATACYLLKKEDLPFIPLLLRRGNADNAGDLIKWLVEQSEVYGYVFQEHWFDVGTEESLREASLKYEN